MGGLGELALEAAEGTDVAEVGGEHGVSRNEERREVESIFLFFFLEVGAIIRVSTDLAGLEKTVEVLALLSAVSG